MENCPFSLGAAIGQFCPESIADGKSRFWQVDSSSVSKTEIVCPEPRRAMRTPFMLDGLNRFCPKSKSILPVHRGRHNTEILDCIVSKDELEVDSDAGNQTGFFCGSPPVRTGNPVVQDHEFAKLNFLPASPIGSYGTKAARSDKGSPSCGSPLRVKPKVRVEGFACGSPESPRVVQAMA